MNKTAKIISIVLTLIITLSVSISALITTVAAETVTFSLNKVSESSSTCVVSVNLEIGSFNNASFEITVSDKIKGCMQISKGKALQDSSAMAVVNADSCKAVITSVTELSQKGEYFVFYFEKATNAQIVASDINLVEKDIDAEIVNNIQENEETTEPDTEPVTEPSTEPSTEPVTGPTTEPVTEPTTKPVTEPTTEPTTEPVTEPTTEPSETTGKCGDNLTWEFDSYTKTLKINGVGSMYDYSAGYYYSSGGYIYRTSAPWKTYYNQVSKVIISDGVTKIGSYAFCGCKNINYLEIPNTTNIGYDSFNYCNNIKNIIITNGSGECADYSYYSTPWYLNKSAKIYFNDDVESIGDYMFYNCGFSSIDLRSQLKYIGERAFYNCTNLQNITIPDGVEVIADGAFINCTGLKNVNLGNSQKLVIDYDVFNGCNSIERFSIGLNNENYCTDDSGVLYNKDMTGLIKYPAAGSLTSYTVNPNTVYINENAFESSSNLQEVILPEDMMSIGSYAFKDCTSLKEANIPDGLVTLCYASFDGCTSVERVVLPESLEILGGYSFRNCLNLKEVIFNCKNCNYINNFRSPFLNAGSESGGFSLTFTDSVNTIPDSLFYNYIEGDYEFDYSLRYTPAEYYVNEITVGKNVTKAGAHSLVHLNHLTTVNYNATDCLYLSFIECENLTSVTISENVSTIPARFLYDCINVNDITLPQNVKRIGCDSITGTGYYNNAENWSGDELRIDNKLIKVKEEVSGEYSFDSDITVVADKAFLNCKITKVTIPSKIITLGYGCFENTLDLKTVNFNAVNCQYAENAFYGSAVETFNIGNHVTILPAGMLTRCDNITELLIPGSVVTIGDELFGYAQTTIRFVGTDRINIMESSYYYKPQINAVIYCKQNSFIHSYLSMKAAPFFLYNDANDVFRIENDLLDKYIGNSEHVFVNFATKIGYGAFENNNGIKSVELSSAVTTIFNAAFKNCKNLQSIIIPQTVSSIGYDAFDGCSNLTVWCYSGSYAESFAKSNGIKISYITIQLSEQEILLNANETCLLNASFSTVISDDNKITWSSDNPTVAKVSADGEITAICEGAARITAKSDTGLCATCLVKVLNEVQQPKVNSVNIDDVSLNYKKSTTINPQIDADDGVECTVTYTSSDPKVATVDENGKVTANGKGEATITCTVTDQYGNVVSDTCNVKVDYTWWQWIIRIVLFGWIWY